jgi:hypothetical protein
MKHVFPKLIGIPFLVMALVLPFAPGVVVAAPPSPQWSAWSVPVNLGSPVNTSAHDSCQVVTKDGMSLYFGSNRVGTSGNYDLWVSHRKSAGEPWGDPQNLGPAINTVSNDRCPYVTPDGHYLTFVSDRDGGKGSGDFYISYRHDQNDDLGWELPRNITEINTPADVYAMWGFEERGLLKLYFGLKPDSATPGDIFSTTMGKNATFSLPEPVSELNTGDHESFPVVRKDGLEMFFNSNRPGGSGGSDLWVTTRQTTSDPWSAPVNLGPVVNSAADESRAALTWDGTTINFASTRPGGLGGYDIYTSTRYEQKYTFTTIDPPGSVRTGVWDLNTGGRMVGYYFDSAGVMRGFSMARGDYRSFDYPGIAGNATYQQTFLGVGPSGETVGVYQKPGEETWAIHGFLLTTRGDIVPVNDPNHFTTVPQRVLPDGTIVGYCQSTSDINTKHGMVMRPDGSITYHELPNSQHLGATPDAGILVGLCVEGGKTRGYVLDHGTLIPFDAPGSVYTVARDVHPGGNVIAGFYLAPGNVAHGFVAERRGASPSDWEFTTVDVPGSRWTAIAGSNASGDLVGSYGDAGGVQHGFIASRGRNN